MTCSAAPIVLNTDAWSEEARKAAIEARKRKGKSSEEEEPERLNAGGQNAETAKRVRTQYARLRSSNYTCPRQNEEFTLN